MPTIHLATVIGDDPGFILGLGTVIVSLTLALGESRWQVSHLREWKREAEVKIAALEVRQGRTDERLDSMHALLTEVRGMVQRLLERDHNHRSVG